MADDAGRDPEFDPFANLPLFGDLAKALQGQGPLNWDAARQFAALATSGGSPGGEANVEPTVRIAYDRLVPIAEMHVRDVTGFEGPAPRLELVTPGVWAQRTLEDYRPLFTELAVSLARPGDVDDTPAPHDPMMAMMAGLSQMMAPAMMGMSIGSMVGRLGTRAFGQYDLPVPRTSSSVLVVARTVDQFADEWSLPLDEMRLWVLAQELIGHSVYSHTPTREAIISLVQRHVGAFRADPSSVSEKLADLDLGTDGDPMVAIQQAFSDPEVLLGAVRSPEQVALAPVLDAATAAVVGYVDYMVDSVAARLIGGDALRIAEAVRRRRIEAGAEDVFIERLLGLQVTPAMVQRGKNFVAGVVDRAGEAALASLFATDSSLPTPAELEAPGLWLARIEL
ncbi:MAG: zinc-dependent metalloprotease [Acidimicrobiales bacterium]|nr:zinc-dependent metalloprotease [Acidimicrobiales bacterium]MCB9396094.1 zinc-dependent metalloprotease [Acidimicrobiaceae bacterium]